MHIAKIVSGGQTGVDRGAIDASIAKSIAYGGWCPKGGWAEDMPSSPGLLERYPNLSATPAADPRQRTEWNVRDSHATLVLIDRRGVAVSPGALLAIDSARQHRKEYLCANVDDPRALAAVLDWLAAQGPALILNIAGPRESEAPGIYKATRRFLEDLLTRRN